MSQENKQKYINNIDGLYPADSDYPDTAATGKELLFEAICKNWRELPEEVLAEYSRLCNFKEMEAERKFNKQNNY